MFGALPEASQQILKTSKKLLEEEPKPVVDDYVAFEAQLELLPEMELSIDETSADGTNTLPKLVSQHHDAISQYHISESEVKVKKVTKDQAQANAIDELKQRSLLEMKLRYDAAARQTKDVVFEDSENDEAREKNDEIQGGVFEGREASNQEEKKEDFDNSSDIPALKSEFFVEEMQVLGNDIEANTTSFDQVAESRHRALLEARLMFEEKLRANAVAETKTKAVMINELKQRSLLEARLRFDSTARQKEPDAYADTTLKDSGKMEAEDDSFATGKRFDSENVAMSVSNEEKKEQEAVKILAAKPDTLHPVETSTNETPDINEDFAKLEQISEHRQRSLLEARLVVKENLRANAAADAKAKANMIAELKQRSLLEARLSFDFTARQREADALADIEIKDAVEKEAKDDIVIEHAEMIVRNEEKEEQEAIGTVATKPEPLRALKYFDHKTLNINDEIVQQEQVTESRQRALLEARLIMEAKAAASTKKYGPETIDANLKNGEKVELVMNTVSIEALGSPSVFVEGENNKVEVILAENGDRDDFFDRSSPKDSLVMFPEIEPPALSLQEKNGKDLDEKMPPLESDRADTSKNNIINMEDETTDVNNKSKSLKGTAWLKPKNSFTELMEKSKSDIFSSGVGHFSSCILESGTTAFFAANFVFEFVTNPEIVETAKKSISLISGEEDGIAKTKKTFTLLSTAAESILRRAGTSETYKNILTCAADATNDFISGCVAMTAYGLRVGGNIRNSYVEAKKAEEEAKIKAEREAEEARKADEERRRIETKRIEAERQALEIIKEKAEKERRRVNLQLVEAEARALKKIRKEANEEEHRIEKEYETSIKVLREKGPTAFLTDAQTKTETELFFAS